jgi:hypothetical protein
LAPLLRCRQRAKAGKGQVVSRKTRIAKLARLAVSSGPHGDPRLTDAILGRILHKARRLRLRGDSRRTT